MTASPDEPRYGPCSGLRVVDTCRVLAGPYCGALLADLGAEIIRVEHPRQLDETRLWSPIVEGVSAAFAAVNHSKKGIALDISKTEGAEVFRRLLATADVLLDNYRPGTLDRYGFGRAALAEINPRLIHCGIKAFPAGTRDEKLPGYEASIQAYSGIMSITGEHDRQPARCGPSVVDMGTGLAATIAVLAALRDRDRTGRGAYVEPALLRTATNLMAFQLASLSLGGVIPQRRGSGHASLVPYGAFETADGPILIAASNDRLWARLWEVLAPDHDGVPPYPSLADRVAGRETVNALIAERMRPWRRQALLDALIAAGIPAAPVQTLEEYTQDTTLETADVLRRLPLAAGLDVALAGPLFGGDLEPSPRTPPPTLGQHTDEILAALGFTADERDNLRRSGNAA